MGIRRRRKKVNTILTTIDRRLRSVELQRVPRVVKDGTITKKMLEKSVQSAIDTGADAATDTPGTTTPQTPTFKDRPFTNIVKIVYTGYNQTGTANDKDRARVYFESDPGLNVGDKIKFASLTGSLDVPTKTAEYVVKEVAVVDNYNTIVYYPGRATIVNGSKTYDKGWRVRAANVTVTGAIVDGTTTKYKYAQIVIDGKDTTPTANDDYKYGPTWPAGIETTSGTHFTGGGFNEGDLINIDGLGTLFDGVHKITSSVTSGKRITIQFEFKDYPTAPVQLPSSNGAIRGAAGRYLRDGETWVDTSVTPAITWIWDDNLQRWWNAADGATLPDGVVVDDGIPPSPPTGLSGNSEGYVIGSKPYSKVNLSWSAPTTNSDGTNLSDLKGYAVFYRYSTADAWTYYSDTALTSETVTELTPEKTVYFSVKAYDATRNMSAYSSSYSLNTVPGTTGINAPSAPTATSRLGQIRVTWNGLDSTGATPPSTLVSYVEVHWSTTSGFTPSDSTYKGKLFGKNDFYSDIDPTYGTNYYFKFVFVDIFGKKSAASAQTTATVQALVDTDLIAGSLNRWPFGANTINTNSLADGSISATYLVSGNDADGTAVRVQGKIAAGSIGATALAANSIVAGKIASEAITAREIKALSIEAGNIKADAITSDKIRAGSITGDKINATTRIRLGDSTATTPTNYIEFGYVTLPGNQSAPGIIGQYGGAQTFYVGGWNGGYGSTSGVALGIIGNNGSTAVDVLTAGGYDNGASLASNVVLSGKKVTVQSNGGSASDSTFGDLTLQSSGSGAVNILAPGGVDQQGRSLGVYVSPTLLIGKTITSTWPIVEGTHISSGFIASTNSTSNALGLSRKGGDGAVAYFYRATNAGAYTNVGNISVTQTACTFNSTSDYRLKENVVDLQDSIIKLKQLKPRTFNFIVEPETVVDGFIAHELQAVVPNAVTGEKDAVDEDGDPMYQSIDTSKIVPLLTSALQEAVSQIESLSARLNILENR